MIILIVIAFIGLMAFPVIESYWYYKRINCDVLYINQEKTKDPRYFAISFTKMIDKQLKEYMGGGTLQLSKNEKVIMTDEATNYPNPCEAVIVAAKNEFHPPPEIEFNKEIYVMQNAVLEGPMKIRAIACKMDLTIGNHVNIVRWADAIGVLKIEDDCDLGICVSSTQETIIGYNCKFRRIYAPIIFLGQHSKFEIKANFYELKSIDNYNSLNRVIYNVKYVDTSLNNEEGIADYSVVTKFDLTVLEDLVIKGNIRSTKRIRICDNTIIYGNVFAEKDIFIGRNVNILGNVFTQENIKIEQGAVIGKENNINSIIARGTMTFEKNCIVYGYVSNERGGKIC